MREVEIKAKVKGLLLFLGIFLLIILAVIWRTQNSSSLRQIADVASKEESVQKKYLEKLHDPLYRLSERAILKPFGIKVSPGNSPVTPERFSGYHTGTDFEIFDSEKDADVPVYAVCGGELLQKKFSQGYGGVAVQECVIRNEAVKVVYGHLGLSSVSANVGSYLPPGERIGILGKGFSRETDGERKHLHLSIYKGKTIDLRGYAQSPQELAGWIDPMAFLQ